MSHNLKCVLRGFLKLACLFGLFLILQRVKWSLFDFQFKGSSNHRYSLLFCTRNLIFHLLSLSFFLASFTLSLFLGQQNVWNTSQLSWFNSLAASRFGIIDLLELKQVQEYMQILCSSFDQVSQRRTYQTRFNSNKEVQHHCWSLTDYSVVILLDLTTVSRFPSYSLFRVLWISVTSSAKFALTPFGMTKSSIESFHVIFPGHTFGTATALCIKRTAGWSDSGEQKLKHDESAKHGEK